MNPNITVSIDRLILDGLPTEGMALDTLAAEVQLALEGLLAERGLHEGMATGGAWESIRGGQITGTESDPGQLGTQIAQAIHAGLGGQREKDRDGIGWICRQDHASRAQGALPAGL